MQSKANHSGVPFHVALIKNGSHFNILSPLKSLVAEKILKDTGPSCSIQFAEEEVQLFEED